MGINNFLQQIQSASSPAPNSPTLVSSTSDATVVHSISTSRPQKSVAIIGGGATAVYIVNQAIQKGVHNFTFNIINSSNRPGAGMPYSDQWVGDEHLANIACAEIPDLIDSPHEWLYQKSDEWLKERSINRDDICEHYLFTRVVLGLFLEEQFEKIMQLGEQRGVRINLLNNTRVLDIEDLSAKNKVRLRLDQSSGETANDIEVDKAVIATGHEWPQRKKEAPQYLDSPWPISKIQATYNHPVGLLGSSLTAVDVVMTLAKNHGSFSRDVERKLYYIPDHGTENFKIVLHSRRGLLPSLRFHFEYPKIQTHQYISRQEVAAHIQENAGYLSLNFMFEQVFKRVLQMKDAVLHSEIKDMSMEEFVEHIYKKRQSQKPFDLFQEEYCLSQQSLRDQRSIYWKEILDDVAYTINFHARALSAEDMIRLKRTLLPLVSHIVAFLPLESSEKILALHEKGKLEIEAIGHEYSIATNTTTSGASLRFNNPTTNIQTDIRYQTFINCLGQKEMPFGAFPFKTLVAQDVVAPPKLEFRSNEIAENEVAAHRAGEPTAVYKKGGSYFLETSGIAVDESFRPVDRNGKVNSRITVLASPHIAGMYPYHSGLPFCNDAAVIIIDDILDIGHQPEPNVHRPHSLAKQNLAMVVAL